MKALVLSGGGLFGAWQAGAWSVLETRVKPDLIVGCSIGAVNGYLIACGVPGDEIVALWREPEFRKLGDFEVMVRRLLERYTLRRPFALTVTDLLAMKVRVYRDGEVTWRHVAASCAVPPVMRPVKLDGRWCCDGGLMGPLPLRAAEELGATEVDALRVMRFWGRKARVPVRMWEPGRRLGGVQESLWGRQADVERWIEQGRADVEKTFSA
jgi:NTE family protein